MRDQTCPAGPRILLVFMALAIAACSHTEVSSLRVGEGWSIREQVGVGQWLYAGCMSVFGIALMGCAPMPLLKFMRAGEKREWGDVAAAIAVGAFSLFCFSQVRVAFSSTAISVNTSRAVITCSKVFAGIDYRTWELPFGETRIFRVLGTGASTSSVEVVGANGPFCSIVTSSMSSQQVSDVRERCKRDLSTRCQ